MSSNIIVKSEISRLVVKSEESNIVVKNADGKDGKDGKSAFQQAVEGGYTGTEHEFNCSLSLLADVAEGKKQIADAISTKGGSASADSSFSKLASDIEDLPIDGNLTYGLKFIDSNPIISNITNGIPFDNQIEEINDTKGLIKNTNGATLQARKSITLNYTSTVAGIFNAPFLSFRLAGRIIGSYFSRSYQEEVIFGKIDLWDAGFANDQYVLRNVEIGDGTDINIKPLYRWTATNVIAEGQSGIDELNNNLRNNLLEKLYDHSTDGQTRTLRLGWLAKVTQENIDYANSKGWTLTT